MAQKQKLYNFADWGDQSLKWSQIYNFVEWGDQSLIMKQLILSPNGPLEKTKIYLKGH